MFVCQLCGGRVAGGRYAVVEGSQAVNCAIWPDTRPNNWISKIWRSSKFFPRTTIINMDSDEYADILDDVTNGNCRDDQLQKLVDLATDLHAAPRVSVSGPIPAPLIPLGSAKNWADAYARRRNSLAGSANPDQEAENLKTMNIALLKILGWSGADPEHVEELVEQFDSVVANSLDIVEAVSVWFERSVPTNGMSEREKEGFKQFLIGVAKRNRTE